MKEAARQAGEALQLQAIAAKGLTGSDAKVEATAPAEPPLKARQRHRNTRRQGQLTRYEAVMHRHQAGESIRAIGRAMRLDHRTVAGLVHAQVFPERAPRAAVPSLLDAHREYLATRVAEGCRNAVQVWRELRARGFTGGHGIVRDAFAQLRGDTAIGGRLHAVAAAVRRGARLGQAQARPGRTRRPPAALRPVAVPHRAGRCCSAQPGASSQMYGRAKLDLMRIRVLHPN